MAKELAFALITPYSLMKSRTGGIMGRLLIRSRLDLVGARMIAPCRELVEQYAAMLRRHGDTRGTGIDEGELLSAYVEHLFMPDASTGRRRRVMLLIFEGEQAVERVNAALGYFQKTITSAETVRDTYGDLVRNSAGEVIFIEPGAISAPTVEKTGEALNLWVTMSDADSGLLEHTVDMDEGPDFERTLVMLKPDNFKFASMRPGTIIDIFSGSGLRIVGAKVGRMSVAEALEFYGPVRDTLRERKSQSSGKRARLAIEQEFGFPLPTDLEPSLGALLGPLFGDRQFNELVQFMTGYWPDDCSPEQLAEPGTSRILALAYAGANAVQRIRDILGPTDPTKAAPGSVRKEYGTDVMVNAAHASDSPGNALREMNIIKIQCDGLKALLNQYYQ